MQERDAYLPLAEKGSKLFFVISDLCKINNMYRFSLASFLGLFQRALHNEQVHIDCCSYVLILIHCILYILALHMETLNTSGFDTFINLTNIWVYFRNDNNMDLVTVEN